MSDKSRGDWWADKSAELEVERNDWMDYAKALKTENESLRKDAELYRRLKLLSARGLVFYSVQITDWDDTIDRAQLP